MTITRRALGAGAVGMLLAMIVLALGIGPGASLASGSRRAARARLIDAAGNHVGTVRITPTARGGTVVRVRTAGLTAGFHGFHVHAVGQCVAPFTSAGGHFNPTEAPHGGHAGDMPPLLVAQDGSAVARFTTDRFTVADLMDADGSAVIVHAAPDNLANIPTRYHSHTYDVFGPDQDTLATGDAGGRVACGVVE
jgi:superoxide dismutase, Cu-Zn family